MVLKMGFVYVSYHFRLLDFMRSGEQENSKQDHSIELYYIEILMLFTFDHDLPACLTAIAFEKVGMVLYVSIFIAF